jgi:antibiotic biosynthesis monooxygenase (ABM) superfamily enzyme
MTSSDEPHGRPRRTRLGRKVVTTLLAWAAAYLVVNIVIRAGGSVLAGAAPAVQTLVISGALVAMMVNVLMPVIAGVVDRLFARHP